MSVTINADGSLTLAPPLARVPPENRAAAGSLRGIGLAVFEALGGRVGDSYTVTTAIPRALHVDVTVAVARRIIWPWHRGPIAAAAKVAAVRAAQPGYTVAVRVLERWRCRSTH